MSTCKRCNQIIIWEKTPKDRWMPMNKDGTSHFDTCPNANEFRGYHFKNKNIDYTKPILKDEDQKTLV